ncbi:MAG: pyridoxal-phosphate dependent enzyme [Bacillota bacterium]|nr:pyridoxal-phosphate dependent enzyme [Bacillota bacterium]
MIDLSINEANLAKTVQLARERNIIIPTLRQMAHPEEVPEPIRARLREVGLWCVDPLNLFRITWHNQPRVEGPGFGAVNYIELPPALTGVPAKIIALAGKWFPTGCHKVGASFGCLAPRMVTGQFDPTFHKAVWPSTGNYCRGGAYNSNLLGCQSIAILPEGMSRERFEWLETVAGEIIATPGCESNVKEIFDKVWELKATRDNVMIFNQFEEMGNHLWHYAVTGPAIEEAARAAGGKFAAAVFASGSAGTLAAGDYLKEVFPQSKLAVGEALQCPTLLMNGYGDHRIEGIGDKHVPWIHNVKNTDMVIAIDDEDSQRLIRLFNDKAGHRYLREELGVEQHVIDKLEWIGISGVANILSAIKLAKYYELGANDIVATVLTDSMEMYGSRLAELEQADGPYTASAAAFDYGCHIAGLRTDNMLELSYTERRRVHNLKYYTWIEQQGRELDELNAQWYDYDNYWGGIHAQAADIDRLIEEFNQRTGLLQAL